MFNFYLKTGVSNPIVAGGDLNVLKNHYCFQLYIISIYSCWEKHYNKKTKQARFSKSV